MKKFLLLIALFFSISAFSQLDTDDSPTYPELINFYKKIAQKHDEVQLYNMGQSDYGLPIYLCLINAGEDSTSAFKNARNSTTILINNAIHAGEPDGINACIAWVNNWIKNGKKKTPVVAIIPAYNVGGMMNRSSSSRANQNGPNEYGFRGNAQNLDLNRDFIKMDSYNMFTFAKIYHAIEPDVFIDTHVSNGADYQYVMTYIAPVKERMAPSMAELQHNELIPFLNERFEKEEIPFNPYVNLMKDVPEKGFSVFNDLPRYAMGYASLFNSISFTTETHMLKSFKDRVKSTYLFIDETVKWSKKNSKQIEESRSKAIEWEKNLKYFKYNYALSKKDSVPYMFKGFEHEYITSEITGLKRLKYDRNKPYKKAVPFFSKYNAKDSIQIPDYFVVGRQCLGILKRLKTNKVQLKVIKDIPSDLKQFRVVKFESGSRPYEGHFLHRNTTIEIENAIGVKEGDVIVPTNQKNLRFILNVLVPNAPDSYFSWNYFDSYVQQKEYFSPYVFEDKAKEILDENEELKIEFEERKKASSQFAKSSWDQLYFIYKNSEFFEPTFNRLPIYLKY